MGTNLPDGAIMVTVNESCKQAGSKHYPDVPAWQTILMSSSFAGFMASAITTPLDRVKTALQTQELEPACMMKQQRQRAKQCQRIIHANWKEAAFYIYKNEGLRGFYRGVLPRILSHTPAVAISWTTYEAAKAHLTQHTSTSGW